MLNDGKLNFRLLQIPYNDGDSLYTISLLLEDNNRQQKGDVVLPGSERYVWRVFKQ